MKKATAAKDQNNKTDSSKTYTGPSQRKTSTGKPVKYRKYTRQDKEEFAAAFLVTGEVKEAAKKVDIPQVTCHNWTKKAWWPGLLENVRLHHQELIESSMTHIIELCTTEIVDRIQYGDYVLKGNDLKRVPVKAEQLARIMGTTQDKLRVLQNRPTNLTATATLDLSKEVANLARVGRKYMYELKGAGDNRETREPDITYED